MRTGRRELAVMLLGLSVMTGTAAALAAGAALADADAPIDLAAWKGKVVYVDFWASWCVPCRQSFPWMNAMASQYGKDGLVIVGVNMDQNRVDADAFLRQYPASFTVRFDPQGKLAQNFKLRGMPTSALLGRDGKVLLVHEGFRARDAATLEEAIRAAIH
jgi:cytochrome c biogenesis protein CcmG/thiol:disulfide interchange protein DsbE